MAQCLCGLTRSAPTTGVERRSAVGPPVKHEALLEHLVAVDTAVTHVCAVRFFCRHVLRRKDVYEDLPYPKRRGRRSPEPRGSPTSDRQRDEPVPHHDATDALRCGLTARRTLRPQDSRQRQSAHDAAHVSGIVMCRRQRRRAERVPWVDQEGYIATRVGRRSLLLPNGQRGDCHAGHYYISTQDCRSHSGGSGSARSGQEYSSDRLSLPKLRPRCRNRSYDRLGVRFCTVFIFPSSVESSANVAHTRSPTPCDCGGRPNGP